MTINERVERRLIGATQIAQPKTILRWQRAGFKTFWRWKSRRHMDAVRIACIKPLLLREAVKEAVASSRVEKLQPKEPQTWKTTRRVGKSGIFSKRSARTLAVMRRRREGTISESRISSHVTHEPQRRTAWLRW